MQAAHTDRFLDPPVTANFTNSATLAGVNGSFERDMTPQDRLRLSVTFNRSGLLVPNELIQQANGQRQDRSNKEFGGQFSYQHTFSANVLATVQGRMRDAQAGLVPIRSPLPLRFFRIEDFARVMSAAPSRRPTSITT